jgi:ABC-type branched-subunit amino acid transport system ATPase component
MTQANLWQGFFNTRPYVADMEKIAERAMSIINDFGLSAHSDKIAAGLPHGTQRVLGIAIAMAAAPDLLLLDEPLAGMDAGETENVADNIRKIIELGITVMMVEHNIKTVIQLCPRVVVLDFGLKIADGKPEEVLNSRDVVEAYLGVD